MAFQKRSERIFDISDAVCQQVTVSEAIRTCCPQVVLKGNGRPHFYALNPWRADRSFGSLVITDNKGLWYDFSSHEGGNGISFVAKATNKMYTECVLDIARMNNIISIDEYEQLSKKKFDPALDQALLRESQEMANAAKKENYVVASEYIKDKVYSAFFGAAGLSSSDWKMLKSKPKEFEDSDGNKGRALSEERIKSDYCTFPTSRKDDIVRHIKKETKISDKDLITVPGFYYDTKEGKVTFVSYRGIGIKIRNSKGRCIAVQIRRKSVKSWTDKKTGKKHKEPRYVWFSSKFALMDNTGRYHGGAPSFSPRDILIPHNPKRFLAITEGRFKSEKLIEFNNMTVSMQGVSCWNGIQKDIKEIMMNYEINTFYLFFDADIFSNIGICESSLKMCSVLNKEFPKIPIRYACWRKTFPDIETGEVIDTKGIDDLANADMLDKVIYVEAQDVKRAYSNAIEYGLEDIGKDSMMNLTEEEREKFAASVQLYMEETLHLPE